MAIINQSVTQRRTPHNLQWCKYSDLLDQTFKQSITRKTHRSFQGDRGDLNCYIAFSHTRSSSFDLIQDQQVSNKGLHWRDGASRRACPLRGRRG